jgi:5-methylcytosine-specific restriction endonuclease McrA
MESALEIITGAELERFNLGTVMINHTKYTVLTGYEGTGRCFWCGGVLKGKLKRYCRGHMTEYYNHFDRGYASLEARKRAGRKCENCGKPEDIYARRTNLEVHHIVPLKGETRYFSAFNLPWNLIILCHDCHTNLHRIMNHKDPKPLPDIFQEAERLGQGHFGYLVSHLSR